MTLQRNSAKYLYIYYLPTGMFVSVSWVSFLIPPDAVPGRIGLLVTLFLVATNIFNTIIDVSPNTEGMTAISSWMIAYMFFVFLALLEYAIILYFLLTRNVEKLKKKRNELLIIHDDDCFLYRNSETCQREEELQAIKEQQLLMKVDSIFLCVFPFVFVIFNALYWVLWTTWYKEKTYTCINDNIHETCKYVYIWLWQSIKYLLPFVNCIFIQMLMSNRYEKLSIT